VVAGPDRGRKFGEVKMSRTFRAGLVVFGLLSVADLSTRW
jgi:hypothetical protein